MVKATQQLANQLQLDALAQFGGLLSQGSNNCDEFCLSRSSCLGEYFPQVIADRFVCHVVPSCDLPQRLTFG
jgi:hypothetical protein